MADSAVPLSCKAERKKPGILDLVKKAQQQALLAIFPRIPESVKDLLESKSTLWCVSLMQHTT